MGEGTLLAWSVWQRLLAAAALSAILWLAVVWANALP